MFFYSETMETILRKQKLATYIEQAVLSNKQGKQHPGPHLVQVVTTNSVSDGVYDYPCHFTCESFRKGSYLRMIKWEVDMQHYRLVIHQAQYLGGAGCEVKHGKQWDLDKLKYIYKSNVYSKNFVIFFQPNKDIQQPSQGFQKLSLSSLKNVLKTREGRPTQEKIPNKRTAIVENKQSSQK